MEKIFQGKNNGVFIEVGANDPVMLSNSYLLEKMGWTGMSFEPIEALCNKWEKARTTKCYPYVCGDREEWVDFAEIDVEGSDNGVMSSVIGYGFVKNDNSVIKRKQMRKLQNIFNENNISGFDLLFVDVEGFELNVLKGIDFNKVNIKCICVENQLFNKGANDLRNFLISNGFVFTARVGCDDIFVK